MWEDMAKVTGDYATLYRREEPPPSRIPVPTHVIPFRVNDDVPTGGGVVKAAV